ncbi:5'-deoxynucleotidase YfbR [Amycolatopsis marina]|uniref:5'-deoxynucleotidase YfbR n=1 Tax=Amycolatopsis marina TaxID=490629 RepID=A0A1I1CHF0_9PSEU|nr:helix-turn-helix transcriptional regulator [Amycolatopsis marina]SFB61964.1 5'-deoxynucleotidase YfbR [Amycolatopsis marina]
MPDPYRPSIRLRRIARTLREWRVPTGLQSGEVAAKAGWSTAKQSRLENATQPITPADVMTLALLYDIAEPVRDKVFRATLAAQERGWWEQIEKEALAEDVLSYVELESEASKVCVFKVDLIPGLLQTSEYAAAISHAFLPAASEELVRHRVNARMKRQTRVEDGHPVHVEAIVTEAALRVIVGGPGVMRRQLGRLVSLSSLPNIDLRVIAANSGAYPAMGTPFSILSFASEEPDVGYVELVDKGVYLEAAENVETYTLNFAGLQEVALSPVDSVELISTIGSSLED